MHKTPSKEYQAFQEGHEQKSMVRKLMLILFALTMYLCASTKKDQREAIGDAMDARRRAMKLIHAPT